MTDEQKDPRALVESARLKAQMIRMGERIAWGSDSACLEVMADALTAALDRAEKAEAERDEVNEAIKDEFKVGFNYAVEAALIELSEADSLELTMHGITPAMTRVLNLKKGGDQ